MTKPWQSADFHRSADCQLLESRYETMLFILTVFIASALCASAMNRMDALSQIESGNNDYAIGSKQEVSRYQILPEFWQQANVAWHPTDPATARIVVNWIMQGALSDL